MAEVLETSVEEEKRNLTDRPLRRHRKRFLKRTPATRTEGRMQPSGSLMKMKRSAVLELHLLAIFAG